MGLSQRYLFGTCMYVIQFDVKFSSVENRRCLANVGVLSGRTTIYIMVYPYG